MDGLRGVLVLIVLIVHVFFLSTIKFNQVMPWYLLTGLWFQPFLYLIGIFLVVSGYCLMLPALQSQDGNLNGGVSGYLKRRLRRILPPYYAAMALSLAHLAIFRDIYVKYYLPVNGFDSGVLWSHLLLFYNFRLDWRFEINSPFWSMAPEWQIYLMFPVILYPVWRKFGLAALVASAALFVAALMFFSKDSWHLHPWFVFLFVSGMAGAVIANVEKPVYARIRDGVPWGAIGIGLVVFLIVEWVLVVWFWPHMLSNMPPSVEQYALNETVLGLAALCAIVHWGNVQRVEPTERWPTAVRLLNHRSMVWLGRFSYSHYLVHWPVVITGIHCIRSLGLSVGWTLTLALVTIVPLSLGTGYVFFLAVEKRFMPSHLTSQRLADTLPAGEEAKAISAVRMRPGHS
jgi:peptidoglycan/LPS O-acetylase OafA/YrhL